MVAHQTEAWHGDRVVIVTGGSRGAGRDLARLLARAGSAVVVDYAHSQGAADATVDEILGDGGAAIAVRADVADELDVERLFLETRREFGGVDLVVEAPGRLSTLIRRAASRHLRAGGAIVSFAGRGRAGITPDIAKIVSWLISAPSLALRDARREVVVVPVSDADLAKRFYEGLGWRIDGDRAAGENFRTVQLTPPGSRASIIFGVGLTCTVPGSVDGLLLSVGEVDSPISHTVSDPDGNTWLLQEIGTRLSGR